MAKSKDAERSTAAPSKQSCRLCYYDTTDTVDLFGAAGVEKDFVRKIRKYLYLLVEPDDDDLAHSICWMCSQNLEAFHQFYTKINEIQLAMHKESYQSMKIPDAQFPVNQPDGANTFEELEGSQNDNEMESYSFLIKDLDESNVMKAEQVVEGLSMPRFDKPSMEKPEDISYQSEPVVKRGRGRPRKSTTIQNGKTNQTPEKPTIEAKSPVRSKRSKLSAHMDVPTTDFTITEDSLDEEDFTKAQVLRDTDRFKVGSVECPLPIIENGMLTLKGGNLMRLICKFYNLQCELCPETENKFKDLHEMFGHYVNVHQTKGYVVCCKSQISRYSAIAMHMATHLQPDAFTCDICGYVVTRPRFLEPHRQTHLPENQKPYSCDICSKTFCWKNALRIHMIQHQAPEDRKMYICDVCGKSYDKPGALSTHKKLQHSDGNKDSLICHICAKKFASRPGLVEHMATIHQPREMHQLQCGECGKWMMNRRCLKAHMQLHSDIQLMCDQCPYVTKKNHLLKRHMATKHSDQTPFACDQCSNSYKTKRAMVVHKTTSHGEKMIHACNFCDRRFNSSTNFYTHRKAFHPVELAEMREKAAEEYRMKRINAGIEDPVDEETTTGNEGSESAAKVVYEVIYEENDQECDGDDGENIVVEIIHPREDEDEDNEEMEMIEMPDEDEDDDEE